MQFPAKFVLVTGTQQGILLKGGHLRGCGNPISRGAIPCSTFVSAAFGYRWTVKTVISKPRGGRVPLRIGGLLR
jgi:hypothetical protein